MTTEPKKLSLVPGGDPSRGSTYPSVSASAIAYVEIFPPLGIARFGDSETEYFLAPEVPGRTNPPAGITKFRDSEQRIRRQAVRFRVYAYNTSSEPLGEVNCTNGYTLNWTVHVANKKAAHTGFQGLFANPPVTYLRNPEVQPGLDLDKRYKLIVDPKPQSISSSNTSGFVNLKGQFQGSNKQLTSHNDVYLGQLQVDDAGRLIFVSGTGEAKSIQDPNDSQPEIVSEFDSTDWIDTACDGWVSVQVTRKDLDKESRFPAGVTAAPPDFAWGIHMPTNLYNVMEDIYWHERKKPVSELKYDFDKDIWPVLKSASLISWTNNAALQGHGPFSNGHFLSENTIKLLKSDNQNQKDALKTRIFERLRKPDDEDPNQANPWFMPRLSGDNGDMPDPGTFPANLRPDIRRFAALTRLQYERFRSWKDDAAFTLPSSWLPEPTEKKLEEFSVAQQPDYLSRAILEPTIGEPLFPGIEAYWLMKLPSTYNTQVMDLKPPFRVKYLPKNVPGTGDQLGFVQPGYLGRGLSLPWQCDFDLCAVHWWPSIRPDYVVPKVTYDITMGKSGTREQFDTAVSTRKNWVRGLRPDLNLGQTRTSTDIPWYGSTDMVRYWNYLGIVRKIEKKSQSGPVVAYVEGERLDL